MVALVVGGRHPGHYFLDSDDFNDVVTRWDPSKENTFVLLSRYVSHAQSNQLNKYEKIVSQVRCVPDEDQSTRDNGEKSRGNCQVCGVPRYLGRPRYLGVLSKLT